MKADLESPRNERGHGLAKVKAAIDTRGAVRLAVNEGHGGVRLLAAGSAAQANLSAALVLTATNDVLQRPDFPRDELTQRIQSSDQTLYLVAKAVGGRKPRYVVSDIHQVLLLFATTPSVEAGEATFNTAKLIRESEYYNLDEVFSPLDKSTSLPAVDVPLFDSSQLSMPAAPRPGRKPLERRLDARRLLDESLPRLKDQLAILHAPIVDRFQSYLDGLVGHAAAALADNHEVAERVRDLADEFGVALFYTSKDGTEEEVKVYPAHQKESALGGFVVRSVAGNKRLEFNVLWPRLRAGRTAKTDEKGTVIEPSN